MPSCACGASPPKIPPTLSPLPPRSSGSGREGSSPLALPGRGAGGEGLLTALAFSPDGKLLASGSEDKTIRLWRLPEGDLLKTLEGATRAVRSLVFTANGDLLVSADGAALRLWKIEDLGQLFRTPVGQISFANTDWAHTLQSRVEMSPVEQAWLDFTMALVQWYHRFDITLGSPGSSGEGPQRITIGEYDIELDD